jgi:hypothetical protein
MWSLCCRIECLNLEKAIADLLRKDSGAVISHKFIFNCLWLAHVDLLGFTEHPHSNFKTDIPNWLKRPRNIQDGDQELEESSASFPFQKARLSFPTGNGDEKKLHFLQRGVTSTLYCWQQVLQSPWVEMESQYDIQP